MECLYYRNVFIVAFERILNLTLSKCEDNSQMLFLYANQMELCEIILRVIQK